MPRNTSARTRTLENSLSSLTNRPLSDANPPEDLVVKNLLAVGVVGYPDPGSTSPRDSECEPSPDNRTDALMPCVACLPFAFFNPSTSPHLKSHSVPDAHWTYKLHVRISITHTLGSLSSFCLLYLAPTINRINIIEAHAQSLGTRVGGPPE